MEVSVQEYRDRIGSFNRCKWSNRPRGNGQGKENLKLWFSGLILVILLVIGGVEVNPGPLSIQEEAEILEFVKKTEES
jgi:hypothetical protein